MTKLIDPTISLDETYSLLLIERRVIEVAAARELGVCLKCRKQKWEHYRRTGGEYCDQPKELLGCFLFDNGSERITAAVEMIERLFELGGVQ